MKIIKTTILALSVLLINLNAQALQEEKRAEFLTRYYNEYRNNGNNTSIESVKSDFLEKSVKEVSEKTEIADSSTKLNGKNYLETKSDVNIIQNNNLDVEEVRAKFLTNYYNEYYNKLESNGNLQLSNTEISINVNNTENDQEQTVDSLAELKKIEYVRKNCLRSLQNENKGIVESAIFVSIQFRKKFPNENVSTLLKALENIIIENEDSKIIYKAQLAKMYIDNSEWFKNIEINSIAQESKVYADIAQTINKKMFSAEF